METICQALFYKLSNCNDAFPWYVDDRMGIITQADLEHIRKASYTFKLVWIISNQLSGACYPVPVSGTLFQWDWLGWLSVAAVSHMCVCGCGVGNPS